jgi:hypothetical protein
MGCNVPFNYTTKILWSHYTYWVGHHEPIFQLFPTSKHNKRERIRDKNRSCPQKKNKKKRAWQDSNLRGQSPHDFESCPLTTPAQARNENSALSLYFYTFPVQRSCLWFKFYSCSWLSEPKQSRTELVRGCLAPPPTVVTKRFRHKLNDFSFHQNFENLFIICFNLFL